MHDILTTTGVLEHNDALAFENRETLRDLGIYTVNLMSGPGAGKTTLLERTLAALKGELRMAVLEGDMHTRLDAERVERYGVPAIQINTGGSCHLEARQVHDAMHHLPLKELDLLFIENVGNLVCPAEFDLGEHDRVMLLSVTEGHDKPRKYPVMFHTAQALLLTKTDLLPYVDFDLAAARREAQGLNIGMDILELSCRSGEGLEAWYAWLRQRRARVAALAGRRD